MNPAEVSGSFAVSLTRGVISLVKALMDLLTVNEQQVLKKFAVGS